MLIDGLIELNFCFCGAIETSFATPTNCFTQQKYAQKALRREKLI